MKKVKYFFWLCSGANRPLLKKCPTEGSKYVGIGGTIFFTGIFAALSGAYALFTVFENYWTATLFGIVWGLMIFNLDRYIVSSMRKVGNAKKEFYTALPRIILAVFISIVIAKPLELKVFEKEINSELKLIEQKSFAEKENVVKQRFVIEQQTLNQEIENLKTEIQSKTQKRDELRSLARQEADGTGGSMKRNAGPIYKIKKADADRVDQELSDLNSKNQALITSNYSRLKEIEALMTKDIQSIEKGKMDGPAARMDALSKITAKSDAIWWANWFVILLFIAVETAPVFVKLISTRGPYDHLLLIEERAIESMMYERLAEQNVSAKKRTRNYPAKEKEYIDSKLEASLNRS